MRLEAALHREINDQVRGSPARREAEDLLTSVPGVGPITARTLIAELPELDRIVRRRIAALTAVRWNPAVRVAYSTPSCATDAHGEPLDPKDSHSVLPDVIEAALIVLI